MSDKLRSYIKNNKGKFDMAEPSEYLWTKIDSKLELNTTVSKSKWLSNLKYFVFGASILVIVIYIISQNLNDSSSNALAQHTKDSALNSSGIWVKTNQSDTEENKTENLIASTNKSSSDNLATTNSNDEGISIQKQEENLKRDSVIAKTAENTMDEQKIVREENIINTSVKEDKPNVTNTSNKNKTISAPETPSEINTYGATLYDGSLLCEVIQAYKFPGKVNMDNESNFQGHRILKTVPCSKLENMGNVKAVWLKGKTSKKLSLSVLEGLKNIVLHKSDGRRIYPLAVSHYYKGLGLISDYTGKHFEMIFKNHVELIVFFKDAEEGDKVIVDGKIEAVVSSK